MHVVHGTETGSDVLEAGRRPSTNHGSLLSLSTSSTLTLRCDVL